MPAAQSKQLLAGARYVSFGTDLDCPHGHLLSLRIFSAGFKNGEAIVHKDGKGFYIDTNGKYIKDLPTNKEEWEHKGEGEKD